MRGALETINAAAESRSGARATVQKRRRGRCWSMYWCFGSPRRKARIRHAILVPESTSRVISIPPPSNSISFPFIAPPSSPASLIQSEPPSSVESPTGLQISACTYSPGPASIFSIGPYAYDTRLVSPPVFYAFTTEPSTAPFTPPPESARISTPSSPEVPFARLLDSGLCHGQRLSFSCYEFQPGSPIGACSPGGARSACDSIADRRVSFELNAEEMPIGACSPGGARSACDSIAGRRVSFELNAEEMPIGACSPGGARSASDSVADRRVSFVLNVEEMPIGASSPGCARSACDSIADRRVSFELNAEEMPTGACSPGGARSACDSIADRRVSFELNAEEMPIGAGARSACDSIAGRRVSFELNAEEMPGRNDPTAGNRSDDDHNPSLSEFKFSNVDVDGGVVTGEMDGTKNWAFFPMIQP